MAYGTMSIGNAGFTKKFISVLFLLMHPKGTLFGSDDPTSPAELFGGTWEQIKDRFILAAGDTYAAGNEGGSATHDHETKLFHSWYAGNVNGYSGYSVMPYNYRTKDWARGVQNGTHYALANNAMIETSNEKISNKFEATGTVSESSTMPPYTTKYVWQRIE